MSVEPVIAGSRGFALALLAPLTERIGTRPRIAAGASQAAPLCAGAHGLLVVEFLGAQTLREIEGLVAGASGLRIVAAVAEKHAAADAPLRALGVEVARWDGTSGAILGAVGRQLALSTPAQPASAPPPPPRSPPATAQPPPAPRAAPAAAQPTAPPRPVAAAPRAAPPAPQRPAPPAPPRAAPVPAQPPAAQRAAPPSAQPPAPPAPPAAPVPSPAMAAPASAAPAAQIAPAVAPPRPPSAPAAASPSAWPALVPDGADAADALRSALAGAAPPTLACVAAEIAEELTELERAVLAGAPQPFDVEPIRDAAAMRLRVAAALSTAPRKGEPIDAAAVSDLLGDFDALLSRVNALAEEVPEDARPSIEAIRDELVRQAIRFSQRASPEEPEAAPAPAPAAAPQPRTRLLRTTPVDPERRGHGLAAWIAIAIVALLAGAYHGLRWYERSAARAARTAGAPPGMLEVGGGRAGTRVLVPVTAHERPDAAEIARLRAAEEARGNAVIDANGVLLVVPARQAAPAAQQEPAAPAQPAAEAQPSAETQRPKEAQ